MLFNNDASDKDQWLKNEKRIRRGVICIITAIVSLMVILVFFRKELWVLITNIAVIVGLVVDLRSVIKPRKEDQL